MNAEPMTESLKAARPSGPGKVAVTFAVLVLLVSIVFFLSLSIGPADIEFCALFGHLTDGDADTQSSSCAKCACRAPDLLLIGATLGTSGAALQG